MAFGASMPLHAQATVTANVLTSQQFPPIIMRFGDAYEYLGATEFVLYGVANTTIHLFAQTENRQVSRLYWVQFEGYLPGVDRTYDYSDSEGRTTIAGREYYEDAWVWDLAALRVRPGSDTEQVLALLRQRGLELGPEVVGLRLVSLDPAARNELMIVYLEDVRELGGSATALQGSERSRTVNALRNRALAGLEIEERTP
jgi:hypothetical protein